MTFHVLEYAALSSDRFRDQERSYSRQAKNSGMKLEEFYIAYFGTSFKSQSYSNAGDHDVVSGIFKQPPSTTSSQDKKLAVILFYRASAAIKSSHTNYLVILG